MEGNTSVHSTLFSCRIHRCEYAPKLKALKDFSEGVGVHVGIQTSAIIGSRFLWWPLVVRHTCKGEIPFWVDFLYVFFSASVKAF